MLKREISFTFLGQLLQVVLSLGTAVILARTLGPAGRGVLALAVLLPTIVSTFTRLGQDIVNQTFSGLYKQERSALFFQSLLFIGIGGSLAAGIVYAYFHWLPIPLGRFADIPSPLVGVSLWLCPSLLFSHLMHSLVRGVGRITLAAGILVLQTAATVVGLLLVLVVLQQGIRGAIWTLILVPTVGGLISIVCVRRDVTFWPPRFHRPLLRKSLRFGVPVSLASLAGFLVYRLDQGMLAYMVDEAQVGLYVIAVGLAERLQLLPNSISSAFLPKLANEKDTRHVQVPFVFRVTVLLSLLTMVGVGILGTPLIYLCFGSSFAGSIPSFLLLLPGIAFLGGSSILSTGLIVLEKTKYSVYVGYLLLAVNVGLNLLLIPPLGIAGAAIASSLSYILAMMLWAAWYRRETGLAFREFVPTIADCRYLLSHVGPLFRFLLRRRCTGDSSLTDGETGAEPLPSRPEEPTIPLSRRDG